MQKIILKRASGKNRVEQITEKYEDQKLLSRKSEILNDEMAKIMLKHGDWIKEEVVMPDGTTFIQMVKKMMPITPAWLSGDRPKNRKEWLKSRH